MNLLYKSYYHLCYKYFLDNFFRIRISIVTDFWQFIDGVKDNEGNCVVISSFTVVNRFINGITDNEDNCKVFDGFTIVDRFIDIVRE